MDIIDIQSKAWPLKGHIERYCFENETIGLEMTRFHRIVIPFKPFDSGLVYVDQPEKTELVVEWVRQNLGDLSNLEEVDLSMGKNEGIEASIYLGGTHNWTQLKRFLLTKTDTGFHVSCLAVIEFHREGVGEDEPFEFEAEAVYCGEG